MKIDRENQRLSIFEDSVYLLDMVEYCKSCEMELRQGISERFWNKSRNDAVAPRFRLAGMRRSRQRGRGGNWQVDISTFAAVV